MLVRNKKNKCRCRVVELRVLYEGRLEIGLRSKLWRWKKWEKKKSMISSIFLIIALLVIY